MPIEYIIFKPEPGSSYKFRFLAENRACRIMLRIFEERINAILYYGNQFRLLGGGHDG
jgi:hypothetical protein